MSRSVYQHLAKCRHNSSKEEFETSAQLQILRRKLFLSWVFISQEGLWEEASEFIREYEDSPTPIEC